jgi:hypothetical protein
MQQTAQRRKLKSFYEVTKHVGVDRQIRRLAESLNFAEAQNPKVDLNYLTISISRHLADEEKMEALSEVVDTVMSIQNSDVILLGMWISPTTE